MRASTAVKYHDLLFLLLLVDAIGQSGCCGFVDDATDSESGNFSRLLCRLSFRVVEVGWNRDDRF